MFKTAVKIGLSALVLGGLTFALNWYLMDIIKQPIWGYKVLLFPGNLTLVYILHPIFSEELSYWAKLTLLLIGQFSLVTFFFYAVLKLKSAFTKK